MPNAIPGVHHVTAISNDPVANLEFYTDTLGLRLVKRSVNQDEPSVYHLFYGDHRGTPGTSMTFFAYPDTTQGTVGAGQVHTTQFGVPASSIDWWETRLVDEIDSVERKQRFGQPTLRVRDPDGLHLALIGQEEAPAIEPPNGPVPAEHAIRGFYGVSLAVDRLGNVPDLLDLFGYEQVGTEENQTRWRSHGEIGAVVDILELPDGPRGRPGAGTVHHVAFRVADDEQDAWREELIGAGLRPTTIIDRKWFHSVYTRIPAGILFEFATPSPGYTVDEPLASLGDELVLPEWLEDQREAIEAGLDPLPDPGF